MTFFFIIILLYLLININNTLIVSHDFKSGVKPFSYQTFSGVAMYSSIDAPSKESPGNGQSYVELKLTISRTITNTDGILQLIIIPDTNINDIGIHNNSQVRLCCNDELIIQNKCNKNDINTLIINKNIHGSWIYKVKFNKNEKTKIIDEKMNIKKTAIHVFAMASCSEDSGDFYFNGQSIWMNPYGHLPGDVYGYLPFYGWMCIIYLIIAIIWFIFNFIHWNELLYVQNCITGVLAMCLIEMATWYFDYLHLNNKGTRHHGPFITGLLTTVTRRMVSRMLVVAVSLGFGVVKPKLSKNAKNKIIILGVVYWIFAFMFEALVHWNQTEKVETWMRIILIPPVAIINGIFWWWTFVSLNKTIEQLQIRKQYAKLQLYKSFTIVLIIALLCAISFAIYEMYYVLRQLYFAKWEKLWLMEVGFWQILFSSIFVAIMILWRPSENFKRIAFSQQLTNINDDLDDDEEELFEDDDSDDDNILGGKPVAYEGNLGKRKPIDDDDNKIKNNNNNIKPKFVIGDGDEDDETIDNNNTTTNNTNMITQIANDIMDGNIDDKSPTKID